MVAKNNNRKLTKYLYNANLYSKRNTIICNLLEWICRFPLTYLSLVSMLLPMFKRQKAHTHTHIQSIGKLSWMRIFLNKSSLKKCWWVDGEYNFYKIRLESPTRFDILVENWQNVLVRRLLVFCFGSDFGDAKVFLSGVGVARFPLLPDPRCTVLPYAAVLESEN